VRMRKSKDENQKRINRKQILFNNRELKAIDKYCERFKVPNQSAFMREAIITAVLERFDNHLPSLFEDEHPTLFTRIK
jgi:nickel-dependent lactate racemase